MAIFRISLTREDLIYHWNVAASDHFFVVIFNKSLHEIAMQYFMLILEFYGFNMQRHYDMTLSNILLKNYCIKVTPRSGNEPLLNLLNLCLLN